MTRAYSFGNRQPASIEPSFTPPSEESVRVLAQELYEQRMKDGSAAYLALTGLKDFDLIDVLKDELHECPDSPVSREIKRLVKERCMQDARRTASEVLRTD